MKTLTACIVVYKNDLLVLEKTIICFLNSSLQGTLVVIDNSPADVARALCEKYNIQYTFNDKNIGFGKAHNLALSQIESSDYHLILNPDVYFEPNVLQELFDFMEGHPSTGLVMPKVLYPDGSLQRLCKLLPTPWDLFSRRFVPFKSLTKKRNDRFEMVSSGYDHVMEVPFLSGCFMFLRSSVLKEAGLFDERFFLYAEDTDLSRRLNEISKTMFYPFVEIFHVHARGNYKSTRLTLQNLKSAVQYFNKWGWFFDAERKIINAKATGSVYHYKHLNTVYQPKPIQETA